GSSTAAAPATIELGRLPSQPTSPIPIDETVVEPSTTRPAPPRTTVAPATTDGDATTARASTTVGRDPAKTTCATVAYIGDSVSLGMVSAVTLPNASARLEPRLAEIGVANVRVEISGGRSIVETLSGQENAFDVAKRLRADGFSGCWVVAVGTNDAANIAAGAARQADERIVAMMSVIGSDPVLWIDALTLPTTGFWASQNIVAWDDALAVAGTSYRTLRIAKWSAVVHTEWFESDGIHPTAAGSAARVQFVAAELVANFPST
ncbi:MAG: hypothetical protein ABI862_13175, partial [Ilumatobacteraceae bacterium]